MSDVIMAEVESLPYYNSPDFMPIWDKEEVTDLHSVGNFNFVNQNGAQITEETTNGKVYLTNFFFTSCGSICPKMIRNMEYVQNELENEQDVLFLSHSVMPSVDSVEKLKTYTENFNVDSNRWHFLTGDKAEIYEMARKDYFAEEEPGYNKDSTEFLHTEHFVLVDQNRNLRGIYNGTIELEMDRIIDDIQLLLKE